MATTVRKRPPATVYFASVIVVFFCSLSVADSVGLVPYYIDGSTPLTVNGSDPALQDTSDSTATNYVLIGDLPQLGEGNSEQAPVNSTKQNTVARVVLPTHMQIPSINLDLPVQNPSTRDINALDTLLQKGPARYVDSAKLGQGGTMIIFAHSSHLPIVHNKMYQAFNRIPESKAGDLITITGGGTDYLYRVTSVHKADVNDTIPLSTSGPAKLYLVTCDTLTSKSARFVLEADFVGTAN